MSIHRWLIAIVLLLLAPCFLFASLWIRNTLDAVYHVDRGLDGLEALSTFAPYIRDATMGTQTPATVLNLFDSLDLSPKAHSKLHAELAAFQKAESVISALRSARAAARDVLHEINIPVIVDIHETELTYLISDTLLSVILQSSAMVQTGARVARKLDVNAWDKMAVTVQGGQVKVEADAVSRVTAAHIPQLPADKSAALLALSANYREANSAYQREGSKLLATTLEANTGSDINYRPVFDAFPLLADASLGLWSGTINYLIADLEDIRDAKLLAVTTASAAGVFIILLALGMVSMLARNLAVRTAKTIDQLGYHDPLTNLPNRRALVKALNEENGSGNKQPSGLLLLDIRHFKSINSRYGDQFGDLILKHAARMIEDAASDGDMIARTGGTEFMVLRTHMACKDGLNSLAHDLIKKLGRERRYESHTLRLDCCIGLSETPQGTWTSDALLTDVSLAVRHAKQAGASRIATFDPQMRSNFDTQTQVAKELRTALETGRIVPWFQPQVCIHSGTIVGAEALVRWVDTPDGVRYPGAFLGAAAEAGYMDAVDEAVRRQALEMTLRASRLSRASFHVGLNVSASMLMDERCVDRLLAEVTAAGVLPSQVNLEILEAVMIDEYSSAPILSNVARLSELGFFIELDDFGTGHSSISSLRDLKVDRVKIDRSFVHGVDRNSELQRFTRALIQLARSLDISILAEGVETEGESAWLAANGCQIVQGYLISKAVPQDKLIAQLTEMNGKDHPIPQQGTFGALH